LFTVQGIELLQWSYTETAQVSLSGTPPGLYFLQATFQEGARWIRAVEKVVVVRKGIAQE